MKFGASFSVFVLLLVATGVMSTPVHAESEIAVIDLSQVIDKSVAGKDLQEKYKGRKEALRSEASAYEKDLSEKEQTLIADSKTLDKAAFLEKKKSYEVGLKKKRQEIMNKTINLEKSKNLALKSIQDKVADICANIADAKKIKIVVDRSAVVIAHQSLDITGEVIGKIDSSMKSVSLK